MSMEAKEKVLVCWSGGKDSALGLHAVREAGQVEVAGLLTTITEDYDRVSMHGIRRSIVESQGRSMGLPLEIVRIPKDASHDAYASRMREALEGIKQRGVAAMVFGDLFLADVRKYREERLAEVGMKAIFPLWKRDTTWLAGEFIRLGFKAILTCVDSQKLDGSFAGRFFDEKLLSDLPPGVDPCGENGEFHTLVFDGPIFTTPIACTPGEVVVREDRFHFCDVLPLER